MSVHVAEIISILEEEYPHTFKMSEKREDVWLAVLGDMDGELLKAAVVHYISTSESQFPPSSGQLRRMALSLTPGQPPSAAEAWKEIQDYLGQRNRMRLCKEGAELRQTAINSPDEYAASLIAINNHEEICDVCGWYQSEFVWSHAIVKEAMETMGEQRLRDSTAEGVEHGQFNRVYEQLSQRTTEKAVMLPQVKELTEKLEAQHERPQLAETGARG